MQTYCPTVNTMAEIYGLLRVSWILFMLISSVTCLPAPKDHGPPGSSNPAPSGFVDWLSTSGSSYPNAGRLDSSGSLSSSSGSLLQFPAAQNPNNKPGSVGWGGSLSGPQATGSMNNAGGSNTPTGAYGSLSSPGYGHSGYGNTGVGTGLGYRGLGGSFSGPQVTDSINKGDVSKRGYSAPTGIYGSLASTGYGNTGVGTGLSYGGLGSSFSGPQATGSMIKGGVSNAGGSNAPTGAYGSLSSPGYGHSGNGNAGVGTGLSYGGLGSSFSGPQATGSASNAGGYYAPTGGYASLASTGNDARYGGYSNAGEGTGLYYTNSGSTDNDGGNTRFNSDGNVEESPEPVLSDLSDLEPVYAFSSRSRYQRGRSQFYQTHYTPGEVQLPSVAVSRPEQSSQAPAKGGF